MKLIELMPMSHYRTVFKKDWDLPDAVKEYLISNGYEELGAGIYSVVFGRPGDNIVIKVGQDTPEEDPWVDYVEWLRGYQNNPHFPRVGKIKWFTDKRGRKFYLVAIERLAHDRSAYSVGEKLRSMDDWVKSGAKVKDLERFYKDWRSWNKQLVQAFIDLRRKFPDYTIDFHQGNIMYRGKTEVLTDPLSFRPKK